MSSRPTTPWRALCLLPLLTACASAPPVVLTKIQEVPQQVPLALLSCAPEPAVPAGSMQSDVAGYLLDALDAGDDCRAKLGAVRALVTPP